MRYLPSSISFGRPAHMGSLGRPSRTESTRDAGGDLALCRSCLQTCDDTIRRVGAFYSLRAADLDDFMQDAWLAVFNALAGGRYDPRRGRLADWLHIVARNRAVTFFRRRWRVQSGVVEVPLDLLECRLAEDPQALLDRSCDIQQVQEALGLLEQRVSPLCYAVFYLRRIQQCAVGEVASNLGLTREQVRVYDHRARRKLELILLRQGFS